MIALGKNLYLFLFNFLSYFIFLQKIYSFTESISIKYSLVEYGSMLYGFTRVFVNEGSILCQFIGNFFNGQFFNDYRYNCLITKKVIHI